MIRHILSFATATAILTMPVAARDKDRDTPKVTPAGEPIICRKTPDTGSLVKKTKRCYTQAQWTRIADAARANGQRLTSDNAAGISYIED